MAKADQGASMIINLFYLSNNNTGGWITFTAHLYNSLQMIKDVKVNLFKIRERTENTERDFGYGIKYRNINMTNALNLDGVGLVVALQKNQNDECNILLQAGVRIVVHDPAELKNSITQNPIVIRANNKQYFEDAKFIPHPYIRRFGDDTQQRNHNKTGVSISRIDFDKNTDILLRANRVIRKKKDKIDILGFENRLYTRFKIVPEFPEWEQSKVAYPREMDYAVMLLRDYKYMVDMSAIKGDGGGTQYTFLEAMDAGSVCILNSKWFDVKGPMKDGENCLSASDHIQVINRMKTGNSKLHFIRKNAYKMLKNHDPKKIARRYIKELSCAS